VLLYAGFVIPRHASEPRRARPGPAGASP
jgi:hypothetical protein